MKQEPTYTLIDDRVIATLDETLASIRGSLSEVRPLDTASALLLNEIGHALSEVWTTAAVAAKHAVHLGRADLSLTQQTAAEGYFERYLAARVRPNDAEAT